MIGKMVKKVARNAMAAPTQTGTKGLMGIKRAPTGMGASTWGARTPIRSASPNNMPGGLLRKIKVK